MAAAGRARRAVVGLFDRQDAAQTALRALRAAGFSDQAIGVVMRDLGSGRDLDEAVEGGAANGAATGAATGGMVGGLLGLLGSLLLPGVGPIVASGVLGSALVGAGAGAATGGLIGGLVGLGLSPDDARHFDRGFRAGGVLVSVTADGERADTAVRILSQHGADLGPSRTPYSVQEDAERRYHADATYAGPERRVVRL
ncbi:MAG: general stress protein [Gemmatimonadales bacterium]